MLKKTIPEEVTEFIAKEDQHLRSGVVGSLAIAPIIPEIHRPGKPPEHQPNQNGECRVSESPYSLQAARIACT
jgi:hypothetical protein